MSRPDIEQITKDLEAYGGNRPQHASHVRVLLAYIAKLEPALKEISRGGGGWSLAQIAQKALGTWTDPSHRDPEGRQPNGCQKCGHVMAMDTKGSNAALVYPPYPPRVCLKKSCERYGQPFNHGELGYPSDPTIATNPESE